MPSRTSLLCLLAALTVGCRSTIGSRPTDQGASDETTPTGDSGDTTPITTTPTDTGPVADPCDPAAGMEVTSVNATQPWNANEALIDIRLSAKASVAVSCTLDTDATEVHLTETSRVSDTHQLRLAGLIADSTYDCMAAPVCPASPDGPTPFTINTAGLGDAGLPTYEVQTTSAEAGLDYVAVNHQRTDTFAGQRLMVVDRNGNIRWHTRPDGGSLLVWEPEENGFVAAGGYPAQSKHRPRLLRLYGGDVAYDMGDDLPDVEESLFHHDGRRLSDGRYLSLEERIFQNNLGIDIIGFAFRIVDPAKNTVDFDWSSLRAYDEGHVTGGSGNTFHANWANVYDVGGTEVLHASLCGRSWTVAIDVPSGDWRWAFGAGGDFTLLDTDGTPLPDSEYPQCQHGLERDGDRLLVYDNGNDRGFSRVTEYLLDESKMTATVQWQWTEAGWFERNLGNVDWTTSGTVMIGMGHREPISPTPGDHSTIVEIDQTTGTKLWEMRQSSIYDQFYRADPIDPCALFSNAKYCTDVADRLDTLSDLLTPAR